MNGGYDPITRWLAAVAVTLLSFILVWALVASARRPAISERLDNIEHQLSFVSCLLLIPVEERVPQAVADCQVTNSVGGP